MEKTVRVQELQNELDMLATALANIGRSPGLAPVQYSEIATLLQKVRPIRVVLAFLIDLG